LYDALLEELGDEATQTDGDEDTFEAGTVGVLGRDEEEVDDTSDDDDDESVGTDLQAEQGADEKPESLLGPDEAESWSDDPVRMYLTQMGEIPLLTRAQEIYLAKKIETTRARFRAMLLECDYVIRSAFKVLRRVHEGELPFDRTVQVSVTDALEKDQILGRLPHN
jgi:RNA polymerase primary sigma factor